MIFGRGERGSEREQLRDERGSEKEQSRDKREGERETTGSMSDAPCPPTYLPTIFTDEIILLCTVLEEDAPASHI